MQSYLWFFLAALTEIAGCFTFWMWLRLGKTVWWILPGMASLALFAFALTRVETTLAGRAYAAYGGIYILSALLWMAVVEKNKPDAWDLSGTVLCLLGSALILLPSRA